MGSISHHIMPLVINSLAGGHTHTHTDIHRQSNSKKPGEHQPAASVCSVKYTEVATRLPYIIIKMNGSESWSRKVELTRAQLKKCTTVRIYAHNNEAWFCSH